MRLSGRSLALLRIASGATLAFIYIPLGIIVIYAFNADVVLQWPPPGLTLGDYIAVQLLSTNQFIGTVVSSNITNNLPFAAAFATVPIVIMVIYLLLARRAGAFEHV